MSDDQIINDVLDAMKDRQQHSIQALVLKISGRIDSNFDFFDKMKRRNLVKAYTKDGEMITDFGMDVIEAGGWIKYLESQQMTDKPKHHWSGIGANLATTGMFGLTAYAIFQSFDLKDKNNRIEQFAKRIEQLTRDSLKQSSTKDSLLHLLEMNATSDSAKKPKK